MPIAMGRSYPAPSLRRSAGAMLTVMRFCGNSAPAFRIAERTRSFASVTAVSGRPTIWKAGRPEAMSTSMLTRSPVSPITAQPVTLASMGAC
jgi:hypothetical protein